MDYKVQNNGEHNANYEAGHYREEKAKVSFFHEYSAGKLFQERNPLLEY